MSNVLTQPVKRKSSPKGRGPVEAAMMLAAGEDWTVQLSLAIVLMAIHDYKSPYYRTEVEVFFRRGGFGVMFDLDGEAILHGLEAMVGKG